jgi:hypothetical protein
MTEAEWLACDDPHSMLTFLGDKASERQLRLFAVACVRRVRRLLPDALSQMLVEVAEQFADGAASWEERNAAFHRTRRSFLDTFSLSHGVTAARAARDAATAAFLDGAWVVAVQTAQAAQEAALWDVGRSVERTAQAALLVDIFGGRLHRGAGCVAGPSPDAVALAQAAYDSRDFVALPILGDALEDAACADRPVLDHCRGPGPHVRGCWVVDLILGKS